MVFGDSTACGYGCRTGDELPGVLIARGLAEESGQADPAEHQGDRRRHVERPFGSDRRDVRGGSAARRGRDHDRRQRHHEAERHRTVGSTGGPGGSPSAGQRRRRRRRHLPGLRRDTGRFRSRCAGWPAAADYGWRAHRRRRYGRREAFRFRSPTCWPPSSTRRRKCFSPMTCSIRPAAGYAAGGQAAVARAL